MADPVVIRIPASTSHVALVRAAASALAATLDFTYDRITDLHIAIDEVCSRIIATSLPAAVRLEFTIDPEGGELLVSASGDASLRPGAVFLTEWSRAILDAVTDEIHLSDRDGRALVTFRVSKG